LAKYFHKTLGEEDISSSKRVFLMIDRWILRANFIFKFLQVWYIYVFFFKKKIGSHCHLHVFVYLKEKTMFWKAILGEVVSSCCTELSSFLSGL